MSHVPILCRWLLKSIAPIVPANMRQDWEREWYGELWHWIGSRVASGDTAASRVALAHCTGALKDAVHLRREDELTRLTLAKLAGHPILPLAVLTVVALALAVSSHGLEHLRRLQGPLPYRAPEQLVLLRQVNPMMGARLGLPLVKVENWKDTRSFSGLAAYTGYQALVEIGPKWTEVPAAAVDPQFFEVLGVSAANGRLFQRGDQCNDCAVVSYDFWRTYLHSRQNAVGGSYRIAGRQYRVIGVLPENFLFFSDSPSFWTLLGDSAVVDHDSALVYAVARLKPGINRAAVIPELLDLYWSKPPVRHGRSLEVVSIDSLNRDPLYAWLPVATAGVFVLFGLAVCFLPRRAIRSRAWAYFATKTALTFFVVSAAVVEFVHSRGLRLSGVRGFGPETISLWLLVVGAVITVAWAWHDQRKRCRTCLRSLSMPVQMGSRGHVLMDRMSTELLCPTGHGLLWAPEDALESHPSDRWLQLDDSWKDLFAVPDKR